MSKDGAPLYVVFSGTGARYPAMAGAFARFLKLRPNRPIRGISAVSGSAIVAAAYCLMDYDIERVLKLIKEINPSRFLDPNYFIFSVGSGFYKGDKLLAFFKDLFGGKKMGQLPPQIELRISTFDVTTNEVKIWSSKTTPHADLATVVRASMAIPVVFNAVKINDHMHVDGGVAANYPLDIWDAEAHAVGGSVVGFRFDPTSLQNKEYAPPANQFAYLMQIVDGMIEAQSREHMEDARHANTIYVKCDAGGLDFDIDLLGAQKQISQGMFSVENYFKDNPGA